MAKKPTVEQLEQTVEALRTSGEKYRALVSEAPLGVSLIGKGGQYKYVNPKFTEMLGYTLEDIPTGREWFAKAFPDPESRAEAISIWTADLKESKAGKVRPRTLTVTCKSGAEKVVCFRPVTLKSGDQLVTYEDVTDRQRAEEELKRANEELEKRVQERTAEIREVNEQLKVEIQERKQAEQAAHESEEKYRNLVEHATEGIAILQDGLLKYANQRLSEITGHSLEDAIGTPFSQYIHPDEIEESVENYNAWMAGKNLDKPYERRLVHRDGSTVHTEVNIGVITYQNKPALLASLRDITERKQAEETLQESIRRMQIAYDQSTLYAEELKNEIAERKRSEEALRSSEEKYRSLVESTEDSVYLVDVDCNYLFMNEQHRSRFGVPEDQIIGRPYSEFHSPEETKAFTEKVDEVCKTSRSVWHEYRSQRDGRHFLRTLSPVKETDGTTTAVTVLSKDITERKRLEAQLQQAQRMEAIGTLAGGIAHDFNNVLMAIQGHTSLMLGNVDTEHPHFEHLSGIEHTVQRGASLARQLLGFARGGKYEVKSTDLNEIIEETCKMFGRTKKEVEIHTKYQKDIWPAEVDRAQIEQVLLNLYVNAWQAMPQGGHLYVETKHAVFGENDAEPFGIKPGRYVRISVTDTGVGMNKPTQQRIFDPFFTTKEMGRGTGLGLASAYGIIKNHGGIIRVYSEEGEGSTFSIYLPASEKQVEVREGRPVEEIVKGTGTVLLVDDENMVLGVGKEMLERIGYNVLLATSGTEAIEIHRKHKDDIDIVILDMIMPDIGGGDTYDQIKADNPQVKVLLASGYSINGEAAEILKRGCNGFIQKPFNMKELSGRISEILNSK